jgi:DNA-binding transcriptional LysR family regulator
VAPVEPAEAGHVNFRHIQYFLAVYDERSFTRAARRCGVAQPTVTKAIKELEERVGGTLFVRQKLQQARIAPTTLGLVLKPYFDRAIQSLERAERVAARYNGDATVTVPLSLD